MPLRKFRYRHEALADVNMTNLIDIVMVLLIAFILVSNFVQTGLDITIPEVSYATATGKEKIVVAIDLNGKIALNGKPINRDELPGQLQALKEEHPDEQLFVRADEMSLTKDVFSVLSAGKRAGFEKVNLPARLMQSGG